ncbi:phosphoglycolate phosphatase [Luteimonas yindakuii]|uniref:Phosphoglycolate phosphatase n=1 Tax=Luteimonas yindakuii TaxID=2565782 RepID=A0A4Z1R5G6_9GAMM|nr:phosphoglycolate phosphatase [Luteimonas yindakuii]TKS54894.1 phosphoglycolate phosphatase [Luteimonas yindakuii]
MTFPFPAVLFDLDGTLVDSASDIAEAVNRMLAELGLPRVPEARILGWIGEGAHQLITSALRDAGSTLDADAVYARFMVHYEACLLLDPRLYDGVVDTLQALRDRGVRMAVCTNKPSRFVPPLLAAMGIDGYFEGVVGGDSLAWRKPDPRPLLHLAAQLDVEPARCLMVGDSETDFAAARAAGMPVVLVSYGYPRSFDLHAAGALAVIDRFGELIGLE